MKFCVRPNVVHSKYYLKGHRYLSSVLEEESSRGWGSSRKLPRERSLKLRERGAAGSVYG